MCFVFFVGRLGGSKKHHEKYGSWYVTSVFCHFLKVIVWMISTNSWPLLVSGGYGRERSGVNVVDLLSRLAGKQWKDFWFCC